jgi:hypothetical protein
MPSTDLEGEDAPTVKTPFAAALFEFLFFPFFNRGCGSDCINKWNIE